MPRKPRMYLPGLPCHVIQRGNNRQACFFAEQDYLFYLECLKDACDKYNVILHAYVLMTNHVHLLVTPSCEFGISRLMQSIGRRYVQYINKSYQRSGTLWEGRHKASLVDANRYLMRCYRYIELNPVRACMVEQPGCYRWSSFRINGYGKPSELVTPHQLYLELGKTNEERQIAYRELFERQLDEKVLNKITSSSLFSMPLGSNRFYQEIEQTLGRKIGYSCRGRPKKQ